MAAPERAQRYAAAMGLPSHHAAYPNARARVGAVMAAADVELAELRARAVDAEAKVARVEELRDSWACGACDDFSVICDDGCQFARELRAALDGVA